MKFIFSLQKFWWLIVLCIAGFLYVSPFLCYPAFNVIDDGASLRASRYLLLDIQHHTLQHWPNILIEKSEGRMRPLYHLYFFALFAVFGAQPIFYWLGQGLVLGLTLALMGLFLWRVTKHFWFSFLAPLSLLIFVPTAENIYRLGTAEPKQMVCWLLFVLWCEWVRRTGWSWKKMISGTVIVWSCLLFKETSITFLPIFWFFWLWQIFFTKQRSWKMIAQGLVMGFCISSYIFFLPTKTGYSTAFQVNVKDMIAKFWFSFEGNTVLYFSALMVWFSMVIRFFFDMLTTRQKTKEADYFWQIVFSLQGILVIVVGILPWEWTLIRYFYPVYIMGILLVTLEINAWWRRRKQFQRIAFWKQVMIVTVSVILAWVLQEYVFHGAKGLDIHKHEMRVRAVTIMVALAETWLTLLVVSIASGLRITTQMLRREKILWQQIFWHAWLVGGVAITLLCSAIIWKEQTWTAYIVPSVLVAIFLVLEVYYWWRWQQDEKIPVLFLLPNIIALCIAASVFNTIIFYGAFNPRHFVKDSLDSLYLSFDTYQISNGAIQYLMKNIPENAHVYIWETEYEVNFELGLYASRFGAFPMNFYTTAAPAIPHYQENYSYMKYSPDPIGDYAKDASQNKMLLIRDMWWQPITQTPAIATISGKEKELTPNASGHVYPPSVYWQVVK